MKKHLVGFALFVSIIAAFTAAFSLFALTSIPEIEVVGQPVTRLSSPEYCELNRLAYTLNSVHAVADRKQGTLTIYLTVYPRKSSRELTGSERNATFSFYTVTGDEVRFVGLVQDSLVSVESDSSQWILRYEKEWIKNLSGVENLYVVPNVSAGDSQRVSVAAFSKEKASPVLMSRD